jgi:hypothetical protein
VCSSDLYDEIVLTIKQHHQGAVANEIRLGIVAFLNEKLCPFEPDRVIGSGVSEEQSQLLAIHQSTLERLERLNEDLIRQSSEFREGLEKKFEEKVAQVEAEYVEKKERLESDVQASAARIEARERALEEKCKAIDDRDNTHVRREIRDRMLDDVKQRINRFGVSKVTAGKRLPVLFGILILLIAFFVLLIVSGFETKAMDRVAKDSVTDAYYIHLFLLWGRFALFSFGFFGTILYYIKWQNKWAEQHIVSEFQLQQFYIDVNRANWVIESCLEWKKETDTAIPKELLRSIAAGLFVNNQTEPERVIHPADELASALLGTASKLKLRVGENKLEFDKPKKIANKPIRAVAPSET